MKITVLSIFTIFFLASSCKSLKYTKEEDLKNIKMPFQEKDYPDSENAFFSIQNAKGQNLNLIRNRVLLAAKTDLAGKIKTAINTVANQNLSFNNDQERESFDSKATSISQQSMVKILKVDSKTLREKNGDQYDYWVVYKVLLEDVVNLMNESSLGFDVISEQLFKAE